MRKIALLFLLSLSLQAEVVTPIKDNRAGVVVKNEGSQLENLIEKFPKVQEAIDACDAQIKNNSLDEDEKDDCVWGALADIQDEIQEHLENADSSSSGNDPSGYAYQMNNFKKKETKSLKVLGDYLAKRIKDVLYEPRQAQDGTVVAVDHGSFYSLYESQLGKSLILQVSNYCIYADKDGKVMGSNSSNAEEKAKALYIRDQNLKNLSAGAGENDKGLATTHSFQSYQRCLGNIPKVCRGDASFRWPQELKDAEGELYRTSVTDSELDPYKDKIAKDPKFSIISACELNRYMTGVKLALAQVKGVKEEFAKIDGQGLDVKNLQVNPVNTDRLTNIGSNEMVRESGYKEAVEEEAAKLEECAKNPNDTSCEDYLTTEEDNKKVEDEYFIRGLALKKKIETDLTDNPEADIDEVKKYFKSKGMTDESYEKLLAQTEKKVNDGEATSIVEELKRIIKDEYNNEREALQKSLTQRLEKTEKEAQQNIQPGAAPKNPIEDIKKSVASSATDLAEVLHYSNVVSSFLEVSSSDGAKGQNTTALAIELENNFFTNDDGRGVASGNGQSGYDGNLDDLSQFAEDASDSSSENETISLGVDDIDNIQYIEQEKKGNNP